MCGVTAEGTLCGVFVCFKVAARDEDQIGGRTPAGRGGVLRPLWQEAEAVPRRDEGIRVSAPQFSLINNPEANVCGQTDERFSL